jgi:lactoylglutathione lyase
MAAAPPTLNLIVLRARDIERAALFYSKMGLRFQKHRHGRGPEHYSSFEGGFVFELYPLLDQAPTTGTRVGFSVADVDGVFDRLTELGADVVVRPADSEWGRRAVVRDFDGHAVELLTTLDRRTAS